LDQIFKPPYSELKLAELFDGKHSGGELNQSLTTKVADLFTDDYRNNFQTDEKFEQLRQILAENSIEAWKTSVPTRIIHGTSDNFVPMEVSTNIYNEFIKKGVSSQQVQLVPISGADHSGGATATAVLTIIWFLELTN
jgi:pimeloyl-ACP methyl ester carboxylesterase